MTTRVRAEPAPRRNPPQSPLRAAWLAAAVGGIGLALLIVHAARYPASGAFASNAAQLSLPGVSELLALLRTLACLGAINLSALGCGALFERCLPLSAALTRFRLVFRLGVGFALLGVGVLSLAALHQLHGTGFAILLVSPPALWVACSWSRLRSRVGECRVGRPSWLALGAFALFGLLLAHAFLRALGPDHGFDALTYHLAFPERYLFENGIAMTPFSHLSAYIAGTQMLYLLALFLDGPSLAVLIHFEFGALILVALWQLAGAQSKRAAFLAPLFLVADPLFQLELGWAYSDLALAFYATLAAIAFFTFLEKRDGGDERAGRSRSAASSDLLYAGIACGLCCATRYLGALVAVALCLVAWLPPRHARLRENLRACLVLAALSALAMAPWMIRNAVFTGNPLSPLLQGLFHAPGAEYIPPIVVQQSAEFLRQVGMGRDFGALLALPWNLTMASTPGTYADSFGYEISALYLVALLAVLGLALSGRRLRDVPLLVPLLEFSAGFALLWFFTFQEGRFLLPALPPLACAGALAIDGLIAASPRWGRALIALPLLAAAHSQLSMWSSVGEPFALALGRESRPRGEDLDAEAAASFARGALKVDDKLLLWMEPRGFLFRGVDYVPYHIASGSPILVLVHRFGDPEALRCELRRMGVTHILINRRTEVLVPPGLLGPRYFIDDYLADRERVNELVATSAEPMYSNRGFEIHRLDDRACASDTAD